MNSNTLVSFLRNESSKPKEDQFQVIRENILTRTYFSSDPTLQSSHYQYNTGGGCESWVLKPSLIQNLELMHHNSLHQITGYNFYWDGKVTNEDMRAEA